MSEPIKVGDLVVMVRACCSQRAEDRSGFFGKPFTVADIRTPFVLCPNCGWETTAPKAYAAHNKGGVMVAWLKRIPPLSELEGDSISEGDLAEQRRIHDTWAKV